jgi:hypothetical protein
VGRTCGTCERGEVFIVFWLEGPKGRDHWEDLGVSGRITLRWTLGRQGSMGLTGFIWLGIGSSDGFCKYSNEASGYIKKAGYSLTS